MNAVTAARTQARLRRMFMRLDLELLQDDLSRSLYRVLRSLLRGAIGDWKSMGVKNTYVDVASEVTSLPM